MDCSCIGAMDGCGGLLCLFSISTCVFLWVRLAPRPFASFCRITILAHAAVHRWNSPSSSLPTPGIYPTAPLFGVCPAYAMCRSLVFGPGQERLAGSLVRSAPVEKRVESLVQVRLRCSVVPRCDLSLFGAPTTSAEGRG